jgi:hypothetical protein
MLSQPLSSSARVSISFEPLEDVHRKWRSLTQSSPLANLYHSERWIEALRLTYGFRFQAAIAEHDGMADAGILFARVRRPLTSWWVALPFSDACPPLTVVPGAEAALLSELQRDCISERFEIRGVIAPPEWQSADYFLSWELDISGSVAKLYRSLESNFRRNVAKARKSGITIQHGNSPDLIDRFYRLHTGARRRLGLPCQSLRFFRILRRVFGDNVDVWLASRQGHDAGAIFLIGEGDRLYFKWSARAPDETSGAVHLLAWSLVENWAGRYWRLDLGRTDARNEGLNRFKHGLGGQSSVLPYAFFPVAPHNLSSEVLSGRRRILADIWRRLPGPVCRGIERFAYQYLS